MNSFSSRRKKNEMKMMENMATLKEDNLLTRFTNTPSRLMAFHIWFAVCAR